MRRFSSPCEALSGISLPVQRHSALFFMTGSWSLISEILPTKAEATRAHSRFQAFLVLGTELAGKEFRLETTPLLEAGDHVCWPCRNSTGTRFAFNFIRKNTNMKKFCFVGFFFVVLFCFWKMKAISKS